MSNSLKTVTWTIHVTLLFVVVLFWKLIWPHGVPFSLFHFWAFEGTLGQILTKSWMLFAWGVVLNIIHFIVNRPALRTFEDANDHLVGGVTESAIAGVFEEIAFRWLLFYNAIIGVKILNWILLGGWTPYEPIKWIYTAFLSPLANFFTLGILEQQLLGGLGWAVGAAIISSNGKFRDGHQYQGLFGWINSWFAGMFLFYIMFDHGLIAAMLVHFLYNMFINVASYIDLRIERMLNPPARTPRYFRN